jgi:uncharacterized protein (DUF433 family)
MMFKKQTIGNFFVGAIDQHRPRAKRLHATFPPELIARQKIAIRQSSKDIPVSEVYRRALAQCPSISIDARRQQGLPCIVGTRIPVHLVIWAVEQSGSIEGALKSYPDLSPKQVRDALYFAETILGSQHDVVAELTPTP